MDVVSWNCLMCSHDPAGSSPQAGYESASILIRTECGPSVEFSGYWSVLCSAASCSKLQLLNTLSGDTCPPDVAIIFDLFVYVEFFAKP